MNSIQLLIPGGIFFPALLAFAAGIIVTSVSILLLKVYRRRNYHTFYSTAESILNESDQLNILINNSPDGIFIKDSTLKYVITNQHFAKLIKVETPENLYGKTDQELFKGKEMADQTTEDHQILSGEKHPAKKETGN